MVALSTTEVECISLTEAVKEGILLKGLLEDIGFKQEVVKVWCDSQRFICLSKNIVFHERTKHVAVKYYFIRDIVAECDVEVLKIHTGRIPAGILTKVVLVSKFDAAVDFLKVSRA